MTNLIRASVKDTAVASSLKSLYRYGWSSDFRNSVYSSLFAKENFNQYEKILIENKFPTVTFEDYKKSISHHINHYFSNETIVERLVDLSAPLADPGRFIVDGNLVDSRDGVSLEILERAYRLQYELTGDLKDMNFNTRDVLTIDNARKFINDCLANDFSEPVTIDSSNKKLKLYFIEPEYEGHFPKIDRNKILESLKDEYPDIDDNEIENLVSDFEENLNEVTDVFNACQNVHLNWSKHQEVSEIVKAKNQTAELSM